MTLLLFLLLTACVADKTTIDIPSVLLTCKSAPHVPQEPVTQKQLSMYILDLEDSWKNCYNRLKTVRDILNNRKN